MRNLRESSLSSPKTGSRTSSYTDDAGRLTNVADAVGTSGLGGSYVWNADGTLASMPANGYRRVMGYDEEGRLTAISKLQNGVTTALFQYGYGFDGNRRWRKDLAGGVQDWYPCGVACCAGELVILRSTNGGSTWTTLERKLSKGSASFVDGAELLAPTASGTRKMQGTTETATTDAFGVIRAGSYGTKLSSQYEPLRGDAGLEQAQKSLGDSVFFKQKGPKSPPRYTPRPKPLATGPGLTAAVGTALVISNGLCGMAIIAIADDVQNKPGPPKCSDVCKAIDIYKDQVRNGSLLVGLANYLACKDAVAALSAGCFCK